MDKLVVALDVGSHRVRALVVGVSHGEQPEVLGLGNAPSKGISRSMVVDIEAATRAIERAINQCAEMGQCRISSVTCNLGGSHLATHDSEGAVPVSGDEITPIDVERVYDAARAIVLPPGQTVVKVVPRQFLIDGQAGILVPVGMSGVRLAANVTLVTGSQATARNLKKCLTGAGVECDQLLPSGLAAAAACLSDADKDLGVCLVDIGGGTTDVAVFKEGALRYMAVLPVAGEHLTKDLAVAAHISAPDAERIKCEFGTAYLDPDIDAARMEEPIPVRRVDGTQSADWSRRLVVDYMQPRVREILEMVGEQISASGLGEVLGAGVVLTGGTARLERIAPLAKSILGLPVRLGQIQGLAADAKFLSDPGMAGLAGLALHASTQDSEGGRRQRSRQGEGWSGIGASLKKLFKQF
ncbi:cell division protein FtsA [Litorivicinus lipolyticus]|nr:cell division protein FtsA [Litorivicinus lipolyticus]